MFALKIFSADPHPSLGCALEANLGQSLARVNMRCQHPLRAEIQYPEKSPLR